MSWQKISLLFFLLTFAGNTLATNKSLIRVINKPDPNQSRPDNDNDGGVFDDGIDGGASSPGDSKSCKTGQHMPLKLARSLMVGPDDLKVEVEGNDLSRAKVYIPSYYSTCMDMDLEIKKDSGSNNLYFSFKNKKFESEYNDNGSIKTSAYHKYVNCLEDKGVAKEVDGEYQLDAEKMERKPSSFQVVDLSEFDLNPKYDVGVSYLGPDKSNNEGYDGAFGDIQSNGCYGEEPMSSGGSTFAYRSPESLASQMAFNACSSGSAREILRARKDISERDVGNANDLKDSLTEALAETLERDGDDILDQLKKVGNKLEFDEDGNLLTDREDAKKYVDEYLDELHQLDRTVLNPFISLIDDLKEKRAKATDEDEIAEYDRLIEKYNGIIQKFAKNSKEYGYNHVMAAMKHYGSSFDEIAEKVEGLRLKSHYFGDYNPVEDSKQEFHGKDEIAENIDDRLKKIKSKFKGYASNDLSRNGNKGPALVALKKYKRYKKLAKKRWLEDKKEIREDYFDCMGGSFAIYTQFKKQRCAKKVQRAKKYALRRRKFYMKKAEGAKDRYQRHKNMLASHDADDENDGEDDNFYWYEDDYDPDFSDPLIASGDLYSIGTPNYTVDNDTGFISYRTPNSGGVSWSPGGNQSRWPASGAMQPYSPYGHITPYSSYGGYGAMGAGGDGFNKTATFGGPGMPTMTSGGFGGGIPYQNAGMNPFGTYSGYMPTYVNGY